MSLFGMEKTFGMVVKFWLFLDVGQIWPFLVWRVNFGHFGIGGQKYRHVCQNLDILY